MPNYGLQFLVALLKAATNWYIWLPLLVMAGFKMIPLFIEGARFRKAGLQEIDGMDGRQFEKYLENLFTRLGYHVQLTPYSGDKGADLILTKGGERIAVQAKCHSRKIGNSAVQEVYGAMPVYGCNRAIVVSNREFTQEAVDHARACKVQLWGRSKLADLINSVQGKGAPVLATPIASARQAAPANQAQAAKPIAQSAPICKRCGRQMELRKGPRGSFWGCPNYPKGCGYTLDLQE